MGAGASTVVSPAAHPQQHSTSIVPYVDRDRDRDRDRNNMSSPAIYQQVPAPSGGMLNPYELAPLYAHYARSMLPRRPLAAWGGAGIGLGLDWDMVPPMGRMMVDVRVREGEDEHERGRRRSRRRRNGSRDRHGSQDRGKDRDKARGRGKSRSRSRHWSRGKSRGGWYSSDEGKSRGRWWSRSRGRDGRDWRDKPGRKVKRSGRSGRIGNWRKARGEDEAEDEYDEKDFDEDFDEDSEFDEEDFTPRRGRGNRRRLFGGNNKGKKRKQKPPRRSNPLTQVTDPGSRNMFRNMSRRIDGMDERLMSLEDYVGATQEARAKPFRENPRYPIGYGSRDFGRREQYNFGGRGSGRHGGGMGVRRPSFPQRGPTYGRGGMGPLDELDDGGLEMDFGDDDAAQMNTHSDPQGPSNRPQRANQNQNANYPGGHNGSQNSHNAPESVSPAAAGPSPNQSYQQRPTPRNDQENFRFQPTSYPAPHTQGIHPENPTDGPSQYFPPPPPNHRSPPYAGNPSVPPPPPPPGGFRAGPPGDWGAQRPQVPPGFEGGRSQPGREGRGPEEEGIGYGPERIPDRGQYGQGWPDDLRGEDGGPPLD